VSARDRRTVGELLATGTTIARETLLDMSADQAPAMVMTWSRVVVSAARLWVVLPPAALTTPLEPGRISDQAVKQPGLPAVGFAL
jgi:hypothetical protein